MGKFISTVISTVIVQWQGGIIPILHRQSWGTVRLRLYGPFNPAVHVATPLAQLQSLVKYICNIMYGLTGYKYRPACLFLLQIAPKMHIWHPNSKKNAPTSAKNDHLCEVWIEWGPEVGAFFIFIGAWGTSRVRSQLCLCARRPSPLTVFPLIH